MSDVSLNNFEQDPMYQFGEARQKELGAEEFVSSLAKVLAEFARPIWVQGDGHGGYVRLLIEREFSEIYGEYPQGSNAQSTTHKRKSVSNTLKTAVYERDKYRCVICQTHLSLSIDHIVPVSLGGSNDFGNLRTLCASCNSRKGARPSEHYPISAS